MSDRSVNRILRKISIPHEINGTTKYSLLNHLNIRHVLLADIYMSKPGLVGKYD